MANSPTPGIDPSGSQKTIVDAAFPPKLAFLFHPHRYKVARGGRWSGKSWAFARALLLLGVKYPLRILCAREVQRSIKDSVHRLLKDQIARLQLGWAYTVLETEIRGVNGTEFLFTGLLTHTIDSIKSFEGCDICWVEEAHTVSDRSWRILTPTIRKETTPMWGGPSEIWITYNPDLETDPTHVRFFKNPPPDCANVLVNYRDNPWFDPHGIGEQERLHCLATDPDGYPNIWEGQCRPAVEGAIFYKQIEAAEREGRICNVPYDPMLKVHLVADLGYADNNSIGLFQKHASELRMIGFAEGHQRTWAQYDAEDLKPLKYNWGRFWLPHDGHSKTIHSDGKSSADTLRALGWDVPDRDETLQYERSVDEGIKLVRLNFHRLYIDATRCADFLEHIKRYRRHVNRTTEAEGSPVHDQHCLPAGEQVLTSNGWKSIETVSVGERVRLPHGGYGLVTKSNATRYTTELIEIFTNDGSSVRVTPNHKVPTIKGVVTADTLRYGSIVFKQKGVLWNALKPFLTVVDIGLIEAITLATTSGKRRQGCFIETFGNFITEKYRSACAFITSMATRPTTTLTTSCLCAEGRTLSATTQMGCGSAVPGILKRFFQRRGNFLTLPHENPKIEKRDLKTGVKTKLSRIGLGHLVQKKLLIKRKKLRLSGISQMRAVRGTETTPKNHGQKGSLRKRFALCVVKNIIRILKIDPSSVTTIVRLRRYDVERQPVYNLTVDKHHCYVAGGILVGNSHAGDMLRYFFNYEPAMRNEATQDTRPRLQPFRPLNPHVGY